VGLDILIQTNKKEEDKRGTFLSRLFVRLILRAHDNNDEELVQISQITGIDLTPILDMDKGDASYEEFQLEFEEDPELIKKYKARIIEIHDKKSIDRY